MQYFFFFNETIFCVALVIGGYDLKADLYKLYKMSNLAHSFCDTIENQDSVINYYSIFGSPYGTSDRYLMWIEAPDPKTTFPPHSLDTDMSSVQCCSGSV